MIPEKVVSINNAAAPGFKELAELTVRFWPLSDVQREVFRLFSRMAAFDGGLNGSTQHMLQIVLLAFQTPASGVAVHLTDVPRH